MMNRMMMMMMMQCSPYPGIHHFFTDTIMFSTLMSFETLIHLSNHIWKQKIADSHHNTRSPIISLCYGYLNNY